LNLEQKGEKEYYFCLIFHTLFVPESLKYKIKNSYTFHRLGHLTHLYFIEWWGSTNVFQKPTCINPF
jgi:hypothetical protein